MIFEKGHFKSNRLQKSYIGFLALALGVSVLINLGIIEFGGKGASDIMGISEGLVVNDEQEIPDEQDVVFELRDLVMIMEHGLDLPEGVVLVTLSFNVKHKTQVSSFFTYCWFT
ncbi:hypothetical protein SDC9_86289 [bioreactor metagenome]|uniref:Uncharacterized protein n=1 Tax=bioreactor metagenome TaxID=1076179 RepID=A0A644ZFI8_9ZZZZ|nr:hypothetical protein [Rikenellaceae bacterium]